MLINRDISHKHAYALASPLLLGHYNDATLDKLDSILS
jgi:hypothetical protein